MEIAAKMTLLNKKPQVRRSEAAVSRSDDVVIVVNESGRLRAVTAVD